MKIVFMGTPLAAVPSLEKLIAEGHEIVAVYTQPDKPAGRGHKLSLSPVKVAATDHRLAVLQPAGLRTEDALSTFRSHGADAAVVVAYGRILPEGFLSAFPNGCVNLHFSLLPKYRGAAPANWAIVNGETETGVTTMRMDAGLDTGPILLQRSTPIGNSETSADLMARLSVTGAELLSLTLKQLNSLEPSPQNNEEASYAPILRRQDGEINWTKEAGKIRNAVRGFQPFPLAYTFLNGQKLIVWKANEHKEQNAYAARPGEIIGMGGGHILVACGKGTVLEIQEIQLEGKRRMAAADAVNGRLISQGQVLASKNSN